MDKNLQICATNIVHGIGLMVKKEKNAGQILWHSFHSALNTLDICLRVENVNKITAGHFAFRWLHRLVVGLVYPLR